jgi:hypothetical protein
VVVIPSRAGRLSSRAHDHGASGAAALRVLEACARARGATGAAALAEALHGVDWGSLVSAAASHGMHGILYRRLADWCPDSVPAEARGRLLSLQQAAGRRGLRQEARLLDVLDRLAEHGIRAVPFKGPILAELVYADVSMRVCSDLDVLVGAREVAAARAVLLAAGWRVAGLTRPAGPSLLQTAECELVLEHPASGLYLELHWRTGPRFARASFPAEPLVARAVELDLLGRRVPCLRDDDHVLVLSVHGATHCWDRLELVCTAAEFIAQGRVGDWGLLLRRARALGCRRRLLIACALARDDAGVALPDALDAALRGDAGATHLARQATARRAAIIRPRAPGARVADLVWQAAALDGPSDRVRHLLGRVLTPGARDRDWVHLPSALSAAYYLVRPARLASQYARPPVRRG